MQAGRIARSALIGVWVGLALFAACAYAADAPRAPSVNVKPEAQIPGKWIWFDCVTDNPYGSKAFYGAVFGWETEAFGPATMFRLPGYVGGEPSQPAPRDVVAVMLPSAEGVPVVWGTDFWVADADGAVATVERMGGRVIEGPFDAPPFRQAVVADCGGAVFSLSQLRPELLPA